ncbi:phage holin, lambda family [Budviciaceae bacterium BWR-B9]|uniref:Phage holin, lambda family n=1 Tax=Limnobaculum allomyrinae TaxID=2791986 RepID=A0ABS1IVS3_9GAMM|nr:MULTISPECIES: phage holin, lambda family [Limnobaculum]MBK5145859.1 phage holin, lambda family [Limnobaculum allomyrinae]MBV7693869.1 phage holin, lambda family [Limnobaculum sp. M2-1]
MSPVRGYGPMEMPEKDLNFWTDVANWLNSNAAAITGVAAGFLMSAFKTQRAGDTLKDSFYESSMCALFSLGVITTLEYFGLPKSMAVLAGVIIGSMGTKTIGKVIDAVIARRTGGGSDNQSGGN